MNSDIICNLYRKTISGAIKDRQSNDFLLLSSVYSYIKNTYCNDTKLILVTNDKKDFYKDNNSSEFKELKDNFKDDVVDIIGLDHIKSLYKYINSDVNLKKKIENVEAKFSDDLRVEVEDFEYYTAWYSNRLTYSEVLYEFNKKIKVSMK
ncbi:hypothetical protein Q5M85_21160 [Paraclostridium bifermentans]|nr:hypothetical protein [Paraclostridium bifermentans]